MGNYHLKGLIFVTKEKIKDIVARATKTFVQAFIGSFTIDAFFGVTDTEAIKKIGLSMLVAAVAAGVSAVWNMVLDLIYQKIDEAIPTNDEVETAIQEGFEESGVE